MSMIEEKIEVIKSFENSSWYAELQLVEEVNYLKDVEEDLQNYSPKIAVVGEFSSGKSTLINSFIGRDILPAKSKPTTQFITKIKYAANERIVVDGEEKPLSKKILQEIDTVQSKEINVYMPSPILKQWTFIDTPGTNDPATFTDDIVFDLIGEVDIVLFVFNSQAALRETEIKFISKLVRKKDIGKFFFILNWADTIDEPLVLKNDFMERMALLLGTKKALISNHTFLYSAKSALTHRLKNEEYGRFDKLNSAIESFVLKKKNEFIEEVEEKAIDNAVGSIVFKIETLEEKLSGKSDKYMEEIQRIEANIKQFELATAEELLNFQRQFDEIKHQYKSAIANSVSYVQSEIKTNIAEMDFKELTSSRYIELRVKKLLEDRIEEDTKIFVSQMEKLVKKFDENIKSSESVQTLQIDSMKDSRKAKTVVNMAAVGAVVAGGTAAAPVATTMVGAGTIMAGMGAIAPTMIAIPVVGPFLAGIAGISAAVVPVVGVFALAAGKVLFDVGKWGVGMIGRGLEVVEEKVARIAYARNVNKSLSEIENKLVAEVDKMDVESFKKQYIESMFPEKTLLEKKMTLLQNKQMNMDQMTSEKIAELEQVKIAIGAV